MVDLYYLVSILEAKFVEMKVDVNITRIYLGGTHGEVRLWDIRTKELITHLKEHVSKV